MNNNVNFARSRKRNPFLSKKTSYSPHRCRIIALTSRCAASRERKKKPRGLKPKRTENFQTILTSREVRRIRFPSSAEPAPSSRARSRAALRDTLCLDCLRRARPSSRSGGDEDPWRLLSLFSQETRHSTAD